MTKEDLGARIRAIISRHLADYSATPPAVTNESLLTADEAHGGLELDSLDRVEIEMELEDQFDLPQIGDEESEGFRSVADVIAYVAERLGMVEGVG